MRIKSLFSSFKILSVFSMLLLLSACSTIDVKQDYASNTQFQQYQSYQWLDVNKSKTLEPFFNERFQQAILNNLHQRGAIMVRENPQAYISYDYVLRRTETLEPVATVGLGFGVRHFGFRSYFPMEYETRIYEYLDWKVNIYDRNQKLIWQGSTTTPRMVFDNPQEAEAYTQKVVDSIMNQFPPK